MEIRKIVLVFKF
uniref:Uncharacterized protein n=1 Tax=Anguilla anguilla TaxID=7936 RepID=A0A0E9TR53_ANGAN